MRHLLIPNEFRRKECWAHEQDCTFDSSSALSISAYHSAPIRMHSSDHSRHAPGAQARPGESRVSPTILDHRGCSSQRSLTASCTHPTPNALVVSKQQYRVCLGFHPSVGPTAHELSCAAVPRAEADAARPLPRRSLMQQWAIGNGRDAVTLAANEAARLLGQRRAALCRLLTLQ